MKFDKYDFCEEIQENLNAMSYFRTTDIQFKCITPILNGEDVLAIAQTGTGKTAAFGIPIINMIHEQKMRYKDDSLKCLVLVPTRELAKQIGSVLAKISANTLANTYAIYGGVEQDPQISQLQSGIDVLVATPGRMFDLIHQQHIDVSTVQTLVLDEADHMLDLGFIEDIDSIKRKLKQRHQTLFFSATINPKIKKMAYSQIKSSALRIQVSPENMVSKNVTHYVCKVEMDNKRHLLTHFLQEHPESKVLIFVRTQVRAERVGAHLQKQNIVFLNFHGGMEQNLREQSLQAFRDNKAKVMITTDVSARGIDLADINYVINYDLPDEAENYVHRVGRTGRGFAKGEAISFSSPEESAKLKAIQDFIKTEIPELQVDNRFLAVIPNMDVENMEITDILAMEEALFDKPKAKKNKNK